MIAAVRTVLLSVSLAALAGCAASMRVSTDTPPAAAPAVISGAPARDDLDAVLWMQTATEWEALSRQAFRAAREQLKVAVEHLQFLQGMGGAQQAGKAGAAPYLANTYEAAAKRQQQWNALVEEERTRDEPLEPLAVIVDVDETVLDNSPYQARRLFADGDYEEQSWNAWVDERRARAMPGAVEFAQYAAKQGVAIYYVTNRRVHLRDATADNLRAVGFPVPDDNSTVMTRDDASGWVREKGSRRSLVDRTHRVVLLIGDNLGDFLDGVSADNAVRAKRTEPYREWWGERWIVLPNPAYGSWEEAVVLFCKDPAHARDARACKRGWLRTD